MSYSVGDTVILDGIESVIIYDNGAEAGWGRYLCVDKNHDLSYYINGDDYVDSDNYDQSPGTFGYEWGGYGTATGINDISIGSGLTNTNSLIALNLRPNTSGWYVLWDKVGEFRASHSDKWFVPNRDELYLIYENRSNLNNLSLTTNPYYWGSDEFSFEFARCRLFTPLGRLERGDKFTHFFRTRLCRYTTDIELNSKTVQISCSTLGSQIYYTLDNSNPTQESSLYENTFETVSEIIKAKAYKEGYLPSNIASYSTTST